MTVPLTGQEAYRGKVRENASVCVWKGGVGSLEDRRCEW